MHSDHRVGRLLSAAAAGVLGLILAGIVILNLHILAGLEEGYAASPRQVWDHSALLAVVDVVLLLAGPVGGVVVAWRWSGGARQSGESGQSGQTGRPDRREPG